ncbi:MAG: hypothetical protein HN855_14710 [Anaerolineae bacterium]|jgi:hypothetical protein|nr:hypothetical protein [Anaerolineae bacterium]MBT7070873.1 hypothetical protein [Anaerolineae bacterium]MBT7326407.1 hypothetical protein [Anaerolineae bacterium]
MLKKTRFVMIILAATLLLSACLPATNADGTTIDATQAAAMIETAVSQALNAQATQLAANAAAATPVPALPTNTAIPAATATLVPTITPVVLASPTAVVNTGGSGGGTTVQTYALACDEGVSSSKQPYDLTELKAGDSFDIRFTIVNTGTDTWPAGYDLIHTSGTDMVNGGYTPVQLGEMVPGASHTVGPYDATAPSDSGRQVMGFKLEGGFCFPYIAIIVK